MLYVALVLLISGIIYFFWDRTIHRKKLLSFLLRKTFEKKGLYGFIMHNIKPELDKYHNHYEYGNPYRSVNRCLMKNQFAIKEAVFHFKNLEEILLRKDILNQINSWNLKECNDVLSFISKGLHRDVSVEWASERIHSGKDSLNDLELVNSESLKPVKILGHPEIIETSYKYLWLIVDRVNILLDEMKQEAIDEANLSKLVDSHCLRLHIFRLNSAVYSKEEFNEMCYSQSFQLDMYLIKKSQVEDCDFLDQYINFSKSDTYKKYLT